VGLPVRFAAPDSQRQGRGRVSSDLPVRITQQPDEARRSPKTRRKLQMASSPAASACPPHFGDYGVAKSSLEVAEGREIPFTSFHFDVKHSTRKSATPDSPEVSFWSITVFGSPAVAYVREAGFWIVSVARRSGSHRVAPGSKCRVRPLPRVRTPSATLASAFQRQSGKICSSGTFPRDE